MRHADLGKPPAAEAGEVKLAFIDSVAGTEKTLSRRIFFREGLDKIKANLKVGLS